MVDKLYESMEDGLKEIKNCAVYRENTPQDFRPPGFLIRICGQTYSQGINGRLKSEIDADILYFPEGEEGKSLQEECWETGQTLIREFVVSGFKIKARNLKIEEDTLHFTFKVRFREYQEEADQPMQTMSQNTVLKEE